ncbi:MAG TPA: LPS assembly lipoprotein LptE [Dongiaceae bacterium]|nr:LPS assembly lipoprotein LptE [Dongiaceae bacterium]
MSSSKQPPFQAPVSPSSGDAAGITAAAATPPVVLARRTLLALGTAGFGSLLLSACGFHPLYGDPAVTGSAGGATSAKLSQVEIEPIADRIGQQLHNRLRDRMNPAGQPDKPNYRLQVTLGKLDQEIVNGDNNVRHNTLTMTATYWLSPADNDKSYLMDKVNSRVQVSYDTLDDPYNDISTQLDAQVRAVDQLADMITTRVAAYFAHNAA